MEQSKTVSTSRGAKAGECCNFKSSQGCISEFKASYATYARPCFKNTPAGWWWLRPLIPALGRQRGQCKGVPFSLGFLTYLRIFYFEYLKIQFQNHSTTPARVLEFSIGSNLLQVRKQYFKGEKQPFKQ